MSRPLSRLLITVMGCGLAAAVLHAATRVSAVATLDNSPGNMIRSDGPDGYQDGLRCVTAWTQTSEFFMRTVSPNCSTAIPRTITLDFSQPVPGSGPSCPATATAADGTLDVCGPNSVPDVRVIASGMFANSALTGGSSVTIPFSMAPNFSSTDFTIDFEQKVPVYFIDTNTRQLAASFLAVADLYQYVPGRNGRSSTKVSIGRYYMPFSLRAQKLP